MAGGKDSMGTVAAPRGWREQLLDRLLIAIAPLLTAGVVMAAVGFAGAGGGWLAACVGPLVFFVWVMAFARRAPYRLRAASLIAMLVVATFVGYAVAAFHGNTVLVAGSGVIIAGLLLGRRPMLWVLIAVLLAPLLAGAGMLGGWLPQPAADAISSARLGPWVRTTLVGGCLFSTLAFAITFVVERIERAVEEQRAALEGLRAEQARREQAEAQQREAERAMLQAQKMEVVGQLAAGVAHDFNNVLVVIQGWSELALQPDALASDREEAKEALQVATRQGAALARQLLALGRKNVHARRRFELEPVVRSNIKALRSALPEDVQVRVEPGKKGVLHADETDLQQLLFNLVINARDAMPSGGRICIGCGVFESADALPVIGSTLAPGRWAFVSVEDNGPGIPEQVRDRIFEPFFTTKAIGVGTGLGLATVMSIATDSGGGVALESELGRGTKFTVYLPEAEAAVSQSLPPLVPWARVRSGPARILLLEDDASVRQLIYALLSRDGHKVVAAPDGRHALEEIAKPGARFDLLCTDAVVPLDPARHVIEAFELANPRAPVLIVSGYVQEELTRRGIEEGRYRLLRKPFPPEELAALVDELLGVVSGTPEQPSFRAARV
jgi:signal transduction histidine kinase/ActR/RegA family two-component response regulator